MKKDNKLQSLENFSLTTLKESIENLDLLSFSDKGQVAIAIHNIRAHLKVLEKEILNFEEKLLKHLKEKYPPKFDKENKLISTQISDKETGETFECIEYKQKVNYPFNEKKALENIKISQNLSDLEKDIFYSIELKSKAILKKELFQWGLTNEAIEACFDIDFGDITLNLKKI